MLDERRPVLLPRSLSMLVMVRAVKQRHIPNTARAPGLSTLSETRGSAPPQVNTHPLCPFLLSWTRGLSGGERQCQTRHGGCPAKPGGAPQVARPCEAVYGPLGRKVNRCQCETKLNQNLHCMHFRKVYLKVIKPKHTPRI